MLTAATSIIAVDRLASRLSLDRLIETFPLERVNEAFEASHSGDVIKPVLRMPD